MVQTLENLLLCSFPIRRLLSFAIHGAIALPCSSATAAAPPSLSSLALRLSCRPLSAAAASISSVLAVAMEEEAAFQTLRRPPCRSSSVISQGCVVCAGFSFKVSAACARRVRRALVASMVEEDGSRPATWMLDATIVCSCSY